MKHVFHIAMLAVAAGVVTAPAADAHIVAAANLDGRWQWVWTRAGLIHAGVPPGAAKLLAGPGMIEFKAGRVYKLDPRTGRVQFLAGSFTVARDVATFVFRRVRGHGPPPPGIVPGLRYQLRWSIYRDRLTWSEFPGRSYLLAFTAVPWTRVR